MAAAQEPIVELIEPAPVVNQPQYAPVPVSTDDIRDLYQTPEELDEYYSLGIRTFTRFHDRPSTSRLLDKKESAKVRCS